MKARSRLLSLGFLIVFCTATAWAQSGQLQGELVGPDGNALEGVAITLERTDAGGNNRYELTTNNRGYFVHLAVAPGDYEITFRAGDKQYLTLARLGVGQIEVKLNLQRLEYEGNEFSRISGQVEHVVRDIREMSATATIIRAPANDAEREARAEAARRASAVQEAFTAGRAALDAANYDEAISQFSLAAEADSTQHVIFGNLGVAYERAGMWPEALAAYEEAQTTADFQGVLPEEANYYRNLTLAHAMNGNVDRAISNAENAAAIDPAGAAQSFFNIGAVLTNQGEVEGAADAFGRAIDVNPEFSEAYYQLALAKFGADETIPEAIPLLEKYLELAPNGEYAEGAQGLLEFARGNQ